MQLLIVDVTQTIANKYYYISSNIYFKVVNETIFYLDLTFYNVTDIFAGLRMISSARTSNSKLFIEWKFVINENSTQI